MLNVIFFGLLLKINLPILKMLNETPLLIPSFVTGRFSPESRVHPALDAGIMHGTYITGLQQNIHLTPPSLSKNPRGHKDMSYI